MQGDGAPSQTMVDASLAWGLRLTTVPTLANLFGLTSWIRSSAWTPTARTEVTGWRWRRHPGCDDAADMLARDWPDSDAPAVAEVLKPRSVWAIGDLVIRTGCARRLQRSAAAWKRLDPTPAPEPLMLGTCGVRGILVMRRCPGVPLDRAWDDEAARRSLSSLVAGLLRRRIIHGDLSPNNLLWDGCRLWLTDLDGLRPTLHGLFWRHHLVRTWAWFFHRLPDGDWVREAHDRCCAALGVREVKTHWRAVVVAERRLVERLTKRKKPAQPAWTANQVQVGGDAR